MLVGGQTLVERIHIGSMEDGLRDASVLESIEEVKRDVLVGQFLEHETHGTWLVGNIHRINGCCECLDAFGFQCLARASDIVNDEAQDTIIGSIVDAV